MNQVIPPRTRFLKSRPASDVWAEAVTNPAVKTAVEYALLQFIFEQDASSPNFDTAARNGLKLEGARRFAAILLNLAEKEADRPIKMASDNLPNE